MNILSIESSGNSASAAIVNENGVIAEYFLNAKRNHSISLMPLLSQMLDSAEINIKDMDYIALSTGPGSFTGLRIGAATAKALAHGGNKAIIPVPTLDMLAYNIFIEGAILVPIMDARRGEVYASAYIKENGQLKRLLPYAGESFLKLLEEIKAFNRPAIFLGDACPIHKDRIIEEGFSIAPENNLLQRASSTGLLALELGEEKAIKYNELELIYIRKPQAEREYEERTLTNDRNYSL